LCRSTGEKENKNLSNASQEYLPSTTMQLGRREALKDCASSRFSIGTHELDKPAWKLANA
jgi:hypothetical protein